MKTSESTKNIIPALINVQKELKPVKKDRVNEFANQSYATLDAILAELLPLLASNNLALTQNPVQKNENEITSIGVETALIHSSGEKLVYEPFFMALEKGSKMNMAQSAGSIITYAKRYVISAMFGISTDEDTDGNQGSKPQTNTHYEQPKKHTNQQPKNTNLITAQQSKRINSGASEICTLKGERNNEYFLKVLKDASNAGGYSDIKSATSIQAERAISFLETMYKKIVSNQKSDETKSKQDIAWGEHNGK